MSSLDKSHLLEYISRYNRLTFVTKSSILNAARVLDPSMPKTRRVEQNTHIGKKLLSWVIALLIPAPLATWMNLQVQHL